MRVDLPLIVTVCAGLAVASGCGGHETPTAVPPPRVDPRPPAPPTPTPTPSPATGQVEDLTAARDIVENNESLNQRADGVISRWELPIAVYVKPPARGDLVVEALDQWKAFTGITYILVTDPNQEPLLRVIEEEFEGASGQFGVDAFYPNRRIRLGTVVVRPGRVSKKLFRHELGHALGFFRHPDFSGVMGVCSTCRDEVTPREGAMLANLYTIAHGARLETDGSWRVIR